MDDIRPIPKSLLIHSGELLEEVKGDWGSSGLNHLEDLKKIRVDPSSKVVRDKNNAEIQLVATMIYCCKNSRPYGQTFLEDQIFDFNGQKHRIVSVEPFYDEKNLHHYEIGMVRYAGKSNN